MTPDPLSPLQIAQAIADERGNATSAEWAVTGLEPGQVVVGPGAPQAEPQALTATKVGCEGEDGLLRIHSDAETCDVCLPKSTAAQSGGVDIDTCTDVALLRLFLKRNIAERQRLEALIHQPATTPGVETRFYDALTWALGANGDFATQGTLDGKYWWRGELAERAGLTWDGARYVAAGVPQEPAPPAVLSEATIQGICARISGE